MRQKLSILILVGFALWLSTMHSCTNNQYLPEEEEIIVDSVFFSSDILPIFVASCNSIGCHATGWAAPDLTPGNAYNNLINGNYINVASPDDSELLLWMRGERDDPMPTSGPDPEYNALVFAWISQGALNN